MERIIARILLAEARIDYLKKNFALKVGDRADKNNDLPPGMSQEDHVGFAMSALGMGNTPDELLVRLGIAQIDQLATADPTSPKHKYLQWLISAFIKEEFTQEDLAQVKGDLVTFAELARRKIIKGVDLGRVTYKELKEINDEHGDKTSKRQESKAEDERMLAEDHAEVLFDDKKDVKIIKLNDKEAACHFGKGTRWCTAATEGGNMFDHYSDSGPLYVLISRKLRRKWQLHVETQQLMDEKDNEVKLSELPEAIVAAGKEAIPRFQRWASLSKADELPLSSTEGWQELIAELDEHGIEDEDALSALLERARAYTLDSEDPSISAELGPIVSNLIRRRGPPGDLARPDNVYDRRAQTRAHIAEARDLIERYSLDERALEILKQVILETAIEAEGLGTGWAQGILMQPGKLFKFTARFAKEGDERFEELLMKLIGTRELRASSTNELLQVLPELSDEVIHAYATLSLIDYMTHGGRAAQIARVQTIAWNGTKEQKERLKEVVQKFLDTDFPEDQAWPRASTAAQFDELTKLIIVLDMESRR